MSFCTFIKVALQILCSKKIEKGWKSSQAESNTSAGETGVVRNSKRLT